MKPTNCCIHNRRVAMHIPCNKNSASINASLPESQRKNTKKTSKCQRLAVPKKTTTYPVHPWVNHQFFLKFLCFPIFHLMKFSSSYVSQIRFSSFNGHPTFTWNPSNPPAIPRGPPRLPCGWCKRCAPRSRPFDSGARGPRKGVRGGGDSSLVKSSNIGD